jgi:hypothetical protein
LERRFRINGSCDATLMILPSPNLTDLADKHARPGRDLPPGSLVDPPLSGSSTEISSSSDSVGSRVVDEDVHPRPNRARVEPSRARWFLAHVRAHEDAARIAGLGDLGRTTAASSATHQVGDDDVGATCRKRRRCLGRCPTRRRNSCDSSSRVSSPEFSSATGRTSLAEGGAHTSAISAAVGHVEQGGIGSIDASCWAGSSLATQSDAMTT